jgi:hypothetical protein
MPTAVGGFADKTRPCGQRPSAKNLTSGGSAVTYLLLGFTGGKARLVLTPLDVPTMWV